MLIILTTARKNTFIDIGMGFNVLEILFGGQSLLSSQYVCHKSSSASNALEHITSSLKRSAN